MRLDMQSTVAFDWIHCSSRLDKSCDWMQSNSWFIETLDWMCCCLRLDVQLVLNICFQLIVQSLVSNACDWISQRLVDQMMSYQLIQTTSFAMHPRLVKYNAEALVWMYCSCLLVSCDCWLSSQRAPAESLAQEQNAVVSTYVNDIVLQSLSPNSIC
ncbi:F-box/kelch-repeat protein [Dorcoceras hygrometricum]|uniref:F-box/kelch-repeat protein n=1 Tax=Dorcoceras hygrometricum TaxID=472368 RepID=A0A2Z7DC07_9LAMI|nr:F-box/kelch-repeat protein [Dorcoceras hygrometricum]